MKKSLLLVFACISIAGSSFAQATTGGPDSYGYIWRDSNDPNGPTYNWIDIVNRPGANQIHGLGDDNTIGPVHLPSNFAYYWYTVHDFWIGSNGYIIFSPTSNLIASPFPNIPATTLPQNYMGVFTSDLNLDTTAVGNPGQCWFWVSPGQDSVVVEWYNAPFWQQGNPAYGGSNTFEVLLNYNDSTITYFYNTQVGSSASTTDFSEIGIENNSGSIGLEYGHDVYPAVQYAIRFYPPATTTLQINDASTVFNDNPDNGARFLSNGGAPFYLNTNVRNVGNTTLTSFNVNTVVKNASNTSLAINNTTVGPLNPGQSQFVNQPTPFSPAAAGVYRFITTTQLTGDATPTNNVQTVELDVVDTTSVSIELAYEDGTATTQGLSWSGGAGGAANLFYPPFYPCVLTAVEAFLVDDPSGWGYAMMVNAADSNGMPGARLDSVVETAGNETIGAFNTTQLTAPIVIDSGGFLVTWYMIGDSTILGQNIVAPISNRSFEVLGMNYAPYRSRETNEHMIRAIISRVVGIAENKNKDGFGEFYPNPSNDLTELSFDVSKVTAKNMIVSLYSLEGKLISSETANTASGKISFHVNKLAPGMYIAKIKSDNSEVQRKFTVVK